MLFSQIFLNAVIYLIYIQNLHIVDKEATAFSKRVSFLIKYVTFIISLYVFQLNIYLLLILIY